MEDILKIFRSLEDSGLLLEGVSETIKNEGKEQIGGFLSMLSGTLAASLLGDMLLGKGIVRAGYGSKGEGTIRIGYGSKESLLNNILIPSHPLTNFEMNEFRFNGVYSRDNLPDKIKDGAYVINLDECSDIGTYWRALYVNAKTITYFDSLGFEHIPKEINKFLKRSIEKFTIVTNNFRIQAYNSVICGYICIGFIDFMLKDKSLTDVNNLFFTK